MACKKFESNMLTSIKSLESCPVSNEFLTAKISSWTDSSALNSESFCCGLSNLDDCSTNVDSVSCKGLFTSASSFAAANLDEACVFDIFSTSNDFTYVCHKIK